MRRSLAKAVLIQGGGAVVGMITVFAVSRFLGAHQQGLFATYKNWFDIISTILLLGIPQGMIYAINKGHLSCGLAARMSMLLSAASIPCIMALNAIEARFGYLPDATPLWLFGFMPLGIAGYIYHGLARSVLLTREDGAVFSLLSSLPTFGTAAILTTQFVFSAPKMEAVFSFNGLLCGAVAGAALRKYGEKGVKSEPGWRRMLLRQSGHFFLQSVLLTLQPFIVFFLLRRGAKGLYDVGLFSFSLVALISANSLIGMLAPILYNHWSKAAAHEVQRHLRSTLLWISVALGAVLTASLFFAARLAPLLVGVQFAGAVTLISILAFAAIPLLFTRLAQPALMAANRTDIATKSGLARLICVIALMEGLGGVAGAAVSWVIGEYVAALMLFWLTSGPTDPVAHALPDGLAPSAGKL